MDVERHTKHTRRKKIGRVTVLWSEHPALGGDWVDMDVQVDGACWRGCSGFGTAIEALNYIRTQVFDTDDARDW